MLRKNTQRFSTNAGVGVSKRQREIGREFERTIDVINTLQCVIDSIVVRVHIQIVGLAISIYMNMCAYIYVYTYICKHM